MIAHLLKFFNLIKFGIFLLPVLFAPRLLTYLNSHNRIHTPESAPVTPVALVLGAGLRRNGTPMPVLEDRLDAARMLLEAGKVQVLLLSGDNRFDDYNEPGAMRDYLLARGVSDDKMVLDYAGRRTYDSCYRARDIFGLNELLVVTQNFHLPRALYLCDQLGVKATGVSADLRVYRKASRITWFIRELPATWRAILDATILRPLPVLGDPEHIVTE